RLDEEAVRIDLQVGILDTQNLAGRRAHLRQAMDCRAGPFCDDPGVGAVDKDGPVARVEGFEKLLGLLCLDGRHRMLPRLPRQPRTERWTALKPSRTGRLRDVS